MDLEKIQNALKRAELDGWLFYDFLNRDLLAYRILGLPGEKHTSRRWFYFIPSEGEPVRLVHSVESTKLDALPGSKIVYLPWTEQHRRLKEILQTAKKIAMQYSPMNDIPYISLVDGGTIELIRSFGVEVVSSADLVQEFESLVDKDAIETHIEAGERMYTILRVTTEEIAERMKSGKGPTEYEIQQFMVGLYAEYGMAWDNMPPIIAVNGHAGDPHFEPRPDNVVTIKDGDMLLIDLWARLNQEDAIYYDITWMFFIGSGAMPPRFVEIFNVARDARDKAVSLIRERLAKGEALSGWEVDQACRGHIEEKGYGPHFIHRTGHSIGREVHGTGVNIDNLETPDRRRIVPGCLFSIEPGIYFSDMGVRTEIDVYVSESGEAQIYGPIQQGIVRIV